MKRKGASRSLGTACGTACGTAAAVTRSDRSRDGSSGRETSAAGIGRFCASRSGAAPGSGGSLHSSALESRRRRLRQKRQRLPRVAPRSRSGPARHCGETDGGSSESLSDQLPLAPCLVSLSLFLSGARRERHERLQRRRGWDGPWRRDFSPSSRAPRPSQMIRSRRRTCWHS